MNERSIFSPWIYTTILYRCCLLSFIFGLWSSFGQGCEPVVRTRDRNISFFETLELIVRLAQEKKTNDIVDLSQAQILAGQNLPEDSGRPLTWVRVGTAATFECVPRSSPDSNSGILWRYKNMWFPANSNTYTAAAVSTARLPLYTTERRNNSLYFRIHNITMDNFGDVECVQSCADREADEWCVIASHRLRPKLRAKDVFRTPLRPVRSGSLKWTFNCQTKLLCDQHTVIPGFIWKMNDNFIGVPNHHYMSAMFANVSWFQFNFVEERNGTDPTCVRSTDGQHAYYEATFYVKIFWLYLYPYPPSSVECWVQPDVASGEWYVQKTNVNFND
ncbi:uncharacterized protein LOC129597247 isoform X2 [Paramacrobiotus metropolitanus]|uniref:uncharacterized protein LOC129597247 isoform X2 n=1 Tax=Paramacrobiotus metropolitanus TaxID=2943436 RepID=UPI002445F465|nr:uncharacterized protein LOC129597247 isoform X2 [Paramacrobiotus metropolitanus]